MIRSIFNRLILKGFARPPLFAPPPCSTAHVEREEVSLYVAFQSRRISLEVSFRHALPPRHLRVAWPAVDTFDTLLPKIAEGHQRSLSPFPWSNGTTPGVAREGGLGTTMAVCTMFKNEAPYLEEWLQYHRLLGVSKVSPVFVGM